MPKLIDDVYIQRRVITYITCHLGAEVEHTMKGFKTRTQLKFVLIEVRVAVCLTVAKHALGTWWHYFLEFCYSHADVKKARVKRGKKGHRRYKTQWTDHTTLILKSITDDDGSLYLDEVQQELPELSGE